MANVKSCPSCRRTYSDDAIAFCLVDGAILSAPYDPEATLQMTGSPIPLPPSTLNLTPFEKKPPNVFQELDVRLILIKCASLFILGLVIGGIAAGVSPYATIGRFHYDVIVSLLVLVLVSLFLISGKMGVSLKRHLGIYLLQTLCLWSSFIIGWVVFYDATNHKPLEGFINFWSAWGLVCAFVGSLLSVGLYIWRKRTASLF